jgi:hypothetical protein
MVAFLIFVFIRIYIVLTFFIFFDFFFITLFTFIFRLETTFLCVAVCASLGSEARLCLSHFVELRVGAPLLLTIFIFFKDFFFLSLCMLILQPVNDGLSLLLALGILQVVHVELVLQIVNVSVLFHIDAVIALEFSL